MTHRIARTLTPIQKTREIVLTVLGVEKTALAERAKVRPQLIHNILADRHRSPDVERAVIKYLNKRLAEFPAGSWEAAVLAWLGVTQDGEGLTSDRFGWPSRT